MITCGPDDFVRNIMLTARRHNLTEPTQNVWYTVDLFNASYFGHGAWQRGDQYDLDAYEAYKGTFVLFVSLSWRRSTAHFLKLKKAFVNRKQLFILTAYPWSLKATFHLAQKSNE